MTATCAVCTPGFARLIEPLEDSVRFYNLGDAYGERIEIEGLGQVRPELEYIII